jgi:flavin reductase (DIM6/NTAB) family NADH-FMN oxidoreductase RutF
MTAANPMAIAEKAMAQIQKGAFLTVAAEGRVNTMTIGWATMGYCWRKPAFMVAVRDSRYTFTLIEKAKDYTVSVPATHMKKEIMFCGTKSGRDVDKFAALGLSAVSARKVGSPVLDIPGVHLECRIIVKTAMDPRLMAGDLETLYPEQDYHTLYFGEILACYET